MSAPGAIVAILLSAEPLIEKELEDELPAVAAQIRAAFDTAKNYFQKKTVDAMTLIEDANAIGDAAEDAKYGPAK